MESGTNAQPNKASATARLNTNRFAGLSENSSENEIDKIKKRFNTNPRNPNITTKATRHIVSFSLKYWENIPTDTSWLTRFLKFPI